MKRKFIAALLVGVMAVSLAGCGKDKSKIPIRNLRLRSYSIMNLVERITWNFRTIHSMLK